MRSARRALPQGIYVNALRLRSFPFQEDLRFVASPSRFVIEQNRDAQLKSCSSTTRINPAS